MLIFALSPQKVVIVDSVNSEVTGPNVTKIRRSAEKLIPFNLLTSKLRYCNTFWNGSATMKIGP